MFTRIIRFLFVALALIGIVMFLAWVTSSDPKFNPASFEDQSLEPGIAPPDEATTLAQFQDEDGSIVTLIVESYAEDTVTGLDTSLLGAPKLRDPFAVLTTIDATNLLVASATRRSVRLEQLLPSGPDGLRHIGIGTNFPEHADEAQSDAVFHFPKFGAATPARTSVAAPAGSLMDYEVELCMRFDRPVASLSDFDAAVKGVFLCADFTDRIALLELADPDNLDSGYGFSDAKSGVGYFPTGPFLVIPKDWQSFIADTRMLTYLTKEPRQDARGTEMIKDFRALTEMVLGDMDAERFYFDGQFHKLTKNKRLEKEMTLMSGTSEGVIFTNPARHDYIKIFLAYILQGGPLTGKSLMEFAIPAFIENEVASGHFLQPGDTIQYASNKLGSITVNVTE